VVESVDESVDESPIIVFMLMSFFSQKN